MLKNCCVEYTRRFRKHGPSDLLQYYSDEPVAVEEFLRDLLEQGMGIGAIKHDGVDLPNV